MSVPLETARNGRTPWVLTTLVVFALGVAMRAWIHFAHALPGGMDAAYYPLQARTLLEQGRLMYNDLPLIFLIDAGLARFFMLFGLPIADATLLASQIVDCVSQPLAGPAIFALAHVFSRGRRAMIPGAAAAALLATVSLPAMRMVSDFEKNALALALFAAALWATRRAMGSVPKLKAWILPGGFVLTVAATHVGGLGAAAVTLGAVVAASVLLQGRTSLRQIAPWLIGGVAAGSALIAAVAIADLDRARHLLQAPVKLVQKPAISGLVSMLREGPRGMGRPRGPGGGDGPGDGFPPRPQHPPRDSGGGMDRPDGDFGGPPPGDEWMGDDGFGPPGMGGPGLGGGGPRGGRAGGPGAPPGAGGADPVSLFTCAAVYLAVPVGLLTLWHRRREAAKADVALVLGCAAGAFALSCPFINGEHFMRFVLMAPIPTSVVVAFALCGGAPHAAGVAKRLPRALGTVAAAGLAVIPVVVGRPELLRTRVDDAAVPELKSLAKFAPEAAGAGHTLVVAPHGLQYWAGHFMHAAGRLDRVPDDARQKYQRIFILEQRGRGARGPGGGMVQVPDDAVRIYRGEYFVLWEVPGLAGGR